MVVGPLGQLDRQAMSGQDRRDVLRKIFRSFYAPISILSSTLNLKVLRRKLCSMLGVCDRWFWAIV